MPDDLDPIRERLAKATPGPWAWGGRYADDAVGSVFAVDRDGGEPWWIARCDPDAPGSDFGVENAEFIAHAPSDIATLLAHVDRLRFLCASHGIDPDGCEVCFLEDTARVPGHRLVSAEEIDALTAERDRLRDRVAALEAELAEAEAHLAGKRPAVVDLTFLDRMETP